MVLRGRNTFQGKMEISSWPHSLYLIQTWDLCVSESWFSTNDLQVGPEGHVLPSQVLEGGWSWAPHSWSCQLPPGRWVPNDPLSLVACMLLRTPGCLVYPINESGSLLSVWGPRESRGTMHPRSPIEHSFPLPLYRGPCFSPWPHSSHLRPPHSRLSLLRAGCSCILSLWYHSNWPHAMWGPCHLSSGSGFLCFPSAGPFMTAKRLTEAGSATVPVFACSAMWVRGPQGL